MDSYSSLTENLHQDLLAHPRNIYAFRLLAQVHSKYGNAQEASQTVKNLLEIDPYGLDQETLDALSPAVRSKLGNTIGERGDLRSSPSLCKDVTGSKGTYFAARTSSEQLPTSHTTSTRRSVGFILRFTRGREGEHANDGNKKSQTYQRGGWPSTRGRRTDTACGQTIPEQPGHVHDVARRMAADPSNSLTTAINDLTALIAFSRWHHKTPAAAATATTTASNKDDDDNNDDDTLRTRCVERSNALAAILNPRHEYLAHQALMHVTHEQFRPNYANDETMVSMEPVASIPRERFFASEDNYAWDMAELVAALRANPAAAFRNPLSRAPFTEADVRAIVHHPLGRGLAAVRVEQRELRRGVRPETVDRLEKLAKVMREDEDSMEASRAAMDEFAAYCATLPVREKDALWELRVPATDSHTGMGYDASAGQMFGDAKANKVCGHKAGDFLAQAVDYLRRSRK